VISGAPKGDAEPFEDAGKYLVTWRRMPDGSWDALHEIWNSDNPLPGGE
jgi:ketosteroid isomerase-like protein